MYIGAVAVLPTYVQPTVTLLGRGLNGRSFGRLLQDSKSGAQALREVIAACLFCAACGV